MEIGFVVKQYVLYSRCTLLRKSNLFPLAWLPSMCTIVILSIHVWIGVQHSLKHHEIYSSAVVLPFGRCGLHCIATPEFLYSADCGHLKYDGIFAPTELNTPLEIAW